MSDQGSNIKLTLSNYQGIPCACHMIATVLQHLLQLDRLSCAPLTMDDDESNMIHVTAIRETVNAVTVNARGIFSIPATSSSSECAFSFCGNTLSKKRMRLFASSVGSLAVLNSALKKNVFLKVHGPRLGIQDMFVTLSLL